MPTFKDKEGKSRFHMNPQVGKKMYAGEGPKEEKLEEKISPGIHGKVHDMEKYDGHDHNGHQLAHHVEIHHGGHPQGEPPMHEGHTHHTIVHPHPMHGGEPSVHNHEHFDEAQNNARDSMHADCPTCGGSGEVEAPAGGEEQIASNSEQEALAAV